MKLKDKKCLAIQEAKKSMKKKIISSIMIIILLFSIGSTNGIVLASEKVSINKTQAKLYISGTCKLRITSKDKAKWSSKDKTIATVSKSGVVKGKKAGSTEIYAKINGKTLSCKVTIVNFTKKEAERLVRKYIKANDESGYMPSFILVDHIDGNIYSVHAYDNGRDVCITYNWYNVNKITGKIEPIF